MFKIDETYIKKMPQNAPLKYKLYESIQEELFSVIDSMGFKPDSKNSHQLYDSLHLIRRQSAKVWVLNFVPPKEVPHDI